MLNSLLSFCLPREFTSITSQLFSSYWQCRSAKSRSTRKQEDITSQRNKIWLRATTRLVSGVPQGSEVLPHVVRFKVFRSYSRVREEWNGRLTGRLVSITCSYADLIPVCFGEERAEPKGKALFTFCFSQLAWWYLSISPGGRRVSLLRLRPHDPHSELKLMNGWTCVFFCFFSVYSYNETIHWWFFF